MKATTPTRTAFAALLLLLGLVSTPAYAQGPCTPASPCTLKLYMLPPSGLAPSPIHLAYGDTIDLSFDGTELTLVPYVANWESEKIKPKLKILWLPGALPRDGRFVVALEFEVKSKDASHTPSDREHKKIHLYRVPGGGGKNWVVKDAIHSDGTIHGGTAHMTQ